MSGGAGSSWWRSPRDDLAANLHPVRLSGGVGGGGGAADSGAVRAARLGTSARLAGGGGRFAMVALGVARLGFGLPFQMAGAAALYGSGSLEFFRSDGSW